MNLVSSVASANASSASVAVTVLVNAVCTAPPPVMESVSALMPVESSVNVTRATAASAVHLHTVPETVPTMALARKESVCAIKDTQAVLANLISHALATVNLWPASASVMRTGAV